jgi:hypothetical protein
MGFSSILDISSFFIGMIINLIFVALMCYYFKRKYDYLEVAQNEQAKILYQLIHKPATCPAPCMDFSRDPLTQLKHPEPEPDSDSDSDSDDDSVESTQNDFVSNEIKDIKDMTDISDLSQLNVEEVKMVELNVTVEEVKLDEPLDITLNVEETGNTYSKMSMKQLKDLLSSKGIKPKNNIRKDELIEILSKEIS